MNIGGLDLGRISSYECSEVFKHSSYYYIKSKSYKVVFSIVIFNNLFLHNLSNEILLLYLKFVFLFYFNEFVEYLSNESYEISVSNLFYNLYGVLLFFIYFYIFIYKQNLI